MDYIRATMHRILLERGLSSTEDWDAIPPSIWPSFEPRKKCKREMYSFYQLLVERKSLAGSAAILATPFVPDHDGGTDSGANGLSCRESGWKSLVELAIVL